MSYSSTMKKLVQIVEMTNQSERMIEFLRWSQTHLTRIEYQRALTDHEMARREYLKQTESLRALDELLLKRTVLERLLPMVNAEWTNLEHNAAKICTVSLEVIL